MVSRKRRAILASLVGMLLVTELDRSTPLDISEYTQALKLYCDKWREGLLQQERGAIEARTNQLETAVLQASGDEKRTLAELFGFCQIVLAEAVSGQQSAIANALLSSTIEMAKEGKFSALYVYALLQRARRAIGRFEFTLHCQFLQPAVRDINLVGEEQYQLPALYRGLLYVRCGLLSAYMAHDKKAFTTALYEVAKGSNSIGASPDDQRIVERLDEEYCMLARASAYLYAPMGNAKLGLATLEELEFKHPEACGKRRLVRRDQLFALAYLMIGDYPMAAAHLEAAVENASEDCIDALVLLHTRLKNTSYGKNPDIGRVAVKIHQVKYSELF